MLSVTPSSSAIMDIVRASPRGGTVLEVQSQLAKSQGIDPHLMKSAFRAESIGAYLERQVERKLLARWHYNGEVRYIAVSQSN